MTSRGVVVEVAVAAGDGDARAGGDDARPGDEAGVDVVAQVDREEGRRAYVADGGEAGLERLLRVDDAGDGGVEGRVDEVVDLVVAVGAAAQVGVAVDQAGKNVFLGKVENLGAGRRLKSCGFNGLNTLVCNHESDIVAIVAGCGLEEMTGAYVCRGRRGLRDGAENEKDDSGDAAKGPPRRIPFFAGM